MSIPASQPRFCTECGSPLPPQAKFCAECGTKVEIPPEIAAAAEVAVPPELREKYEVARKELRGDRREVAVLFADVKGYTALSETLDPEEVGLLMQRLLSELAAVVHRYEGYVDKFIGDAIMALFGAPIAHENDAERAVLAGLAMQEVLVRREVEAGIQLALRVGINLGTVVAAHVGSDAHLQYTVMGDAVNVASRLESAAEPDTVLISHAVYVRIADRFDAQAVPPLMLKGKSEPMRAYRVVGFRREPGQEAGRRISPFVGREAELNAVQSFLARIPEGNAGALLVEAEAGAGKSRLLREALGRVGTDLGVAKIDFTQIHLPGQLKPAADLFRQLLGMGPEDEALGAALRAMERLEGAEEHLAGIRGLAAQAFPASAAADEKLEGPDPRLARQNRWRALAALATSVARSQPFLVLFEDVHWADEEGHELLGYLLPMLADDPIGIVVTARPGTKLAWLPATARTLTLRPLDQDAVKAFLGERFGRLRPSVRRALVQRSQGNPLYLEELARALEETAEGDAASVPGTVQGLLQSRIDRLDPSLRVLLQMASVLGARYSVGLLRKMYALEPQPVPLERAIAGLEGEGFLEPSSDDVQEFRHALMQEVAYSSILLRIRKVLHESAARLGEEHFADRLEIEAPFFAHHFWEADLRPLAAPHLWHAGRTAALNYELYAAERFLERLAAVVEEDPDLLAEATERARFLDTYGTVLLNRGRYGAGDTAFERLATLGESQARPEWIGQAFKGRGEIAMFRGQFDQAEVFYAQGLAPLADSEGRLRADLHTGLGLVHYYRAHAEEALEQHREALALRERIDDRLGMAKSFINVGNALHALRDDLAGAQAEYEKALTLAKEVGDRRLQCGILLNLGALALERGDWEHALTLLHDVEELAEELGLSLIRFLSLQNQAECHLALGHVDRTISILETCLGQGEEMLKAPNRVAIRLLLCRTYLTALDDARAAEKLEEARRVAEEMKLTEQDDWIRMSEGRLYAVRGEWSAAARSFAEAVEAANRIGHPVVAWLARAHLARALAKTGGPEVELPTLEFPDYRPVAAVVAYLSADALASRAPSRDAAAALEEAGELAARLRSVALERAAFTRLAKVWDELKEDEAREAAARRAAAAMVSLEQHLPPELRKTFTTHPENAALRPLAPSS